MKLKNFISHIVAMCVFIIFSDLLAKQGLESRQHDVISTQHEQIYIDQAKQFKKNGNKEKAIEYFNKAIEYNPQNSTAYFELGMLFYNDAQYSQALQYYEKACKQKIKRPQAFFNAALCFIKKNNSIKAIEYLKKTIDFAPSYQIAYDHLASLLCENQQYDEAISFFKNALKKNPDSFEISYNLGKSLKRADKLDESIKYLEQSYQKQPRNIGVILELANTYNMINENENSLALYQKILDINPNLNQILYNYAFTLKKMGQHGEAIKIYQNILNKDPNYAAAHFSMALAYLSLGDFEKGWPEYEWRWAAYRENPKKFKNAIWDGNNPEGKTILLYAEQGLGDTFQFIRYANIIKNLGATVIVEAQKPVAKILTLCKYIDQVITRGETIPEFDYYLSLMSLPLIFKTTIDTIPDEIPYLYADQNLVKFWKDKLSCDKNFKVGICWQGNPSYRTQALRHAVAAKSMHVSMLEPLSKIPGVSLYCLQKMGGENQLNEINFKIHTFGPNIDNEHGRFMDTAAIIKNLDLVVTIDTSIAHLAAGLGIPTWIMLPEPADWRWMIQTPKTPWYPNAILFRQSSRGSWKEVINKIIEKLYNKLKISTDVIENNAQDNVSICNEIPENGVVIPYKPIKPKNKNTIEFLDINDMAFEEILDNLIILEVQYEITKNKELLEKIETTQAKIVNLENLYNNIENIDGINTLINQLWRANKQLWSIEQEAYNKENSIFDKKFFDLIKQAYEIYQLKTEIKAQIKDYVQPCI